MGKGPVGRVCTWQSSDDSHLSSGDIILICKIKILLIELKFLHKWFIIFAGSYFIQKMHLRKTPNQNMWCE